MLLHAVFETKTAHESHMAYIAGVSSSETGGLY